MYKYDATYWIFEGVSNIYLISIATVLLAVILAFYISNLLKDTTERQHMEVLNEVNDENEATDGISAEMKSHRRNKESITHFEDNASNTSWHLRRNSSANGISDIDYDSDEIHIDGLVGKLKSKRVKDLEAQLTTDQLEEEKRIEREQLAAIFELLKKQETELNMKEIDETELNEQLALYR